MQGRYRRHSFWAEVYESVLAWYIALPTTVAFFSEARQVQRDRQGRPRSTKATSTGRRRSRIWVLFGMNVLAILAGLWRLVAGQGDEASTILITLGWTVYNLAMLGAALAVARETKQVRVTHRIAMRAGHAAARRRLDRRVLHERLLDRRPRPRRSGAGNPLAVGDTLTVCVTRGDRPFRSRCA